MNNSINGFMIDSIMYEDVLSSKKAFSTISFMNTDIEENGIEEFELSIEIFDMDTWSTIAESGPIIITIN